MKGSVLKNYKITVQNNRSTDDTVAQFEQFYSTFQNEFLDLKLVTNAYNVGGSVNFMKAIESSKSEYTWVLCDDDFIDASDMEDVFEVLKAGQVDLVHVGAHPEKERTIFAQTTTPKQLLEQGYPYFAYSSFMPCNIFRTQLFLNDYLIQAYDNVGNAYPHMPYLFGIYTTNKIMYVSKNQIVTAGMEGQSYSQNKWARWWINTSKLLTTKEDVRAAFFDQFKIMGNSQKKKYIKAVYAFFNRIINENNRETNIIIENFIIENFIFSEKIKFKIYLFKKNNFFILLFLKIKKKLNFKERFLKV